MATYFIEVGGYWQNSKSWFVGPFESKAEAEAWHQQDAGADANVWYSDSLCGGDIRTAWRIYPAPLSKTAATRRGLRVAWSERGYPNVISPSVAPHAAALDEAASAAQEY